MNNRNQTLVRSLTLAGAMAVFTLSGCAAKQGEETQAVNTQEEISFPEQNDAWIEQGTYVNMENLRKIHPGVSKPQVFDLLGRPHFGEGLFAVRDWNYIFNLPKGDGTYQVCQYQISFDKEMLIKSTHWKDQVCSDLVGGRQAKVVKNITLAAQALFAFDSAELSPRGRKELKDVSQRIHKDFSDKTISVTGYTDRLGSDSYNKTLSEQRASTVRKTLINGGVAASAISSRGAGKSFTAKCDNNQSSAKLKACLAPDRRVEIDLKD